jgi:hypothetical protein
VLDPARDLVIRPGLIIAREGRGLFQQMRDTTRRTRLVPLFGGGVQPLQTVHVDDLCEAFARALERGVTGAYVMVGIGLCWAAFDRRVRVPVVGLVTVFYALHALGHVYDTASGRVGPEHWLIDALPIYLPVVVLVVMLRLLVRQPPERT